MFLSEKEKLEIHHALGLKEFGLKTQYEQMNQAFPKSEKECNNLNKLSAQMQEIRSLMWRFENRFESTEQKTEVRFFAQISEKRLLDDEINNFLEEKKEKIVNIIDIKYASHYS